MLNKTAGAAILISTIGLGANAQQAGINIYRCSFSNWFKAIYEVLLGESQGPRFGSFIALYGVEETRALIAKALRGELVTAA